MRWLLSLYYLSLLISAVVAFISIFSIDVCHDRLKTTKDVIKMTGKSL